jgi:hypothetical protein
MSYLFATDNNSVTYTVSKKPNYEPSETLEDSTIRSPFEGGYVQTRARFTRTRENFSFQFRYITNADKVILKNLLNAVKIGADSFTFHHWNDTDYTVRFVKSPTFSCVFRPQDLESSSYWDVQIDLQQV